MNRMTRSSLLVLALLMLVMLMTGAGVAAAPGPQAAQRVPVLIGFSQPPGPAEEGLVRGAGGSIKYTYSLVPAIAATMPEAAISALEANPNVTRIEPDGEVHVIDHTTPSGDAELNNTWGVKHIGAGAAHALGDTGSGITVGVLDTGIDTTHTDLNYDPTCSTSFVVGETLQDGHSHGTHTAGTVAALDNNAGVVGVGPDVRLCIYKVLANSGSGSYSDIIAAVQQAALDGVLVTNNSYGSSQDPGAIVQAAFDNTYAAGMLHAPA
jgi:subtilisin